MNSLSLIDIFFIAWFSFSAISNVWLVYKAMAGDSVSKWKAELKIDWLLSKDKDSIFFDYLCAAGSILALYFHPTVQNVAYCVMCCLLAWSDYFIYRYYKKFLAQNKTKAKRFTRLFRFGKRNLP